MNEQAQVEQQVQALKARLFDAAEHAAEQGKMLQAIADKVGFKGQSFDELLQLIPEPEVTQEEV